MKNKKFYDIQVSGQERPLATYDTYEEAICGLYKAHCHDPEMDVYIKEYEITYKSVRLSNYSDDRDYESQVNFVKSYELDVLGVFTKETA
jgi:hypothetical protein